MKFIQWLLWQLLRPILFADEEIERAVDVVNRWLQQWLQVSRYALSALAWMGVLVATIGGNILRSLVVLRALPWESAIMCLLVVLGLSLPPFFLLRHALRINRALNQEFEEGVSPPLPKWGMPWHQRITRVALLCLGTWVYWPLDAIDGLSLTGVAAALYLWTCSDIDRGKRKTVLEPKTAKANSTH